MDHSIFPPDPGYLWLGYKKREDGQSQTLGLSDYKTSTHSTIRWVQNTLEKLNNILLHFPALLEPWCTSTGWIEHREHCLENRRERTWVDVSYQNIFLVPSICRHHWSCGNSSWDQHCFNFTMQHHSLNLQCKSAFKKPHIAQALAKSD